MTYTSVSKFAEKFGISERTVRNYCACEMFYYRGLREWGKINGYLTDTCLTAQDNYKAVLDYFKIRY